MRAGIAASRPWAAAAVAALMLTLTLTLTPTPTAAVEELYSFEETTADHVVHGSTDEFFCTKSQTSLSDRSTGVRGYGLRLATEDANILCSRGALNVTNGLGVAFWMFRYGYKNPSPVEELVFSSSTLVVGVRGRTVFARRPGGLEECELQRQPASLQWTPVTVVQTHAGTFVSNGDESVMCVGLPFEQPVKGLLTSFILQPSGRTSFTIDEFGLTDEPSIYNISDTAMVSPRLLHDIDTPRMPATDLVAHFMFERRNTALSAILRGYDVSGHGHTLTVPQDNGQECMWESVKNHPGVAGAIHQDCGFYGGDPSGYAWGAEEGDAMTVAAWVSLHSTGANTYTTGVWAIVNAGATLRSLSIAHHSTAEFTVQAFNAGMTCETERFARPHPSWKSKWAKGQWHVAAVYTPAGTKVYVNGVERAVCKNRPMAPIGAMAGGSVQLGTNVSGDYPVSNVDVDRMFDVRMYRTALDAAAVLRIVAEAPFRVRGGGNRKALTHPLVVSVSFDEHMSAGNIATGRDVSRHSLHMVPVYPDHLPAVVADSTQAGGYAARFADPHEILEAPRLTQPVWNALSRWEISDALTVTAVVRPTTNSTGSSNCTGGGACPPVGGVVLGMVDGYHPHRYALSIAILGSGAGVEVRSFDDNCTAVPGVPLSDAQWYRLAASINRTHVDVYIDGARHASCARGTARDGSMFPKPDDPKGVVRPGVFTIGGAPDANCSAWVATDSTSICAVYNPAPPGLVDHVAVWLGTVADELAAGPAAPPPVEEERVGAPGVDTSLPSDAYAIWRSGFDLDISQTLVPDESPVGHAPALIEGRGSYVADGALFLSGDGGLVLGPTEHFANRVVGALSFAAWVKLGMKSGAQKLLGSVVHDFHLAVIPGGNGNVDLQFESPGFNPTCVASDVPFAPLAWRHIALTYGENATHTTTVLYVDGAPAHTCVHAGPSGLNGTTWHATGRTLYVGGPEGAASGGGFRGWLDDVRLYSIALPPEDVMRLERARGFALADGADVFDIAAWYQFTAEHADGASTMLRDSSAQRAHARLDVRSASGAKATPGTTSASVMGSYLDLAALNGTAHFAVPVRPRRFTHGGVLLAAWVRLPADGTATGVMRVFDLRSTLALTLDVTSPSAVAVSWAAGGVTATAPAAVDFTAWTHLACTWRGGIARDGSIGNGKIQLFVNGVGVAGSDQAAGELVHRTSTPLTVARSAIDGAGGYFIGHLDDVVVMQRVVDMAAAVEQLHARRAIAAPQAPPAWGGGVLPGSASSYAFGKHIDALACEWPYAVAVASPPGVSNARAVYVFEHTDDATPDTAEWQALETRVRELAPRTASRPAPEGWEAPVVAAGATVAACGNVIAVGEVDGIGVYARSAANEDRKKKNPAMDGDAWYLRQRLPVLKEVSLGSEGGVTSAVFFGNASTPEDARFDPALPAAATYNGAAGYGGAMVPISGAPGDSLLGMYFGSVVGITKLTVASGRCGVGAPEAACWLRSFTLASSHADAIDAPMDAFTEYREHGVRRVFTLPATPAAPYRATFTFDPPLHAHQILLRDLVADGAYANVAVDVSVVTASSMPGARPPLLAATPTMIYAVDRRRGTCETTGAFTASSNAACDPTAGRCACAPALAQRGSPGGWCAQQAVAGEYVEVDLASVKDVTSIAVRPQAWATNAQSPAVYSITEFDLYGSNASSDIGDTFIHLGTFDNNGPANKFRYNDPVSHTYWHPVHAPARHLRVVARTWYGSEIKAQVGVRTACERGGLLRGFRRYGDGYTPAGTLADGVYAMAARKDVAAVLYTIASHHGVHAGAADALLRVMRDGKAVHDVRVPGAVDVAVTDDGSVVAVVCAPATQRAATHGTLHVFRVKSRGVVPAAEPVTDIPHSCTAVAATNAAGSSRVGTQRHHVFLSCREDVYVYAVTTAAVELLSINPRPAGLSHIDARFGALCAAGGGVASIWSSAPTPATRRHEPVAVAPAGAGYVTVNKHQFTVNDTAQLWVGSGMHEPLPCDGGSGDCVVATAGVETTLPVYELRENAVATVHEAHLGRDIEAVGGAASGTQMLTSAADAEAFEFQRVGVEAARDCFAVSRPPASSIRVFQRDTAGGKWVKDPLIHFFEHAPEAEGTEQDTLTAPARPFYSRSHSPVRCVRNGVIKTPNAFPSPVHFPFTSGYAVTAWVQLPRLPREIMGNSTAMMHVFSCRSVAFAANFGFAVRPAPDGTPGWTVAYQQNGNATAAEGATFAPYEWVHLAYSMARGADVDAPGGAVSAVLYVNGRPFTSHLPPPPAGSYQCYEGWSGVGSNVDIETSAMREVNIFLDGLTKNEVVGLKEGTLTPPTVGSAWVLGDGCTPTWRTGYAKAVAVSDSCDRVFVAAPDGDDGGRVYVFARYTKDGGEEEEENADADVSNVHQGWWARAGVIASPAPANRFGMRLATLTHVGFEYLVVLEGDIAPRYAAGAANYTYVGRAPRAYLHVYRVNRDGGDDDSATVYLTTTTTECWLDGASLSAQGGALALLCPRGGDAGAPLHVVLEHYELVADGGSAGDDVKLTRRWSRFIPDAARGVGEGVMAMQSAQGRGSALGAATAAPYPARLERDHLSWEAPRLFYANITDAGGPSYLHVTGPTGVTLIARYAFDHADVPSSLFQVYPRDASTGPTTTVGFACGYTVVNGTSGHVNRSVVCEAPASGDTCTVVRDAGDAGAVVAFMLRLWPARDRTTQVRMTVNGVEAACGFAVNPSPFVGDLKFGGVRGKIGPLRVMVSGGPASPERAAAVYADVQRYPRARDTTAAEAYVVMYANPNCAGEPRLVVPQHHSEPRCASCWDVCGKHYPLNGTGNAEAPVVMAGAIASMRVVGPPTTAVLTYSGGGEEFIGCFAADAGVAGAWVVAGGASETVASCAALCTAYGANSDVSYPFFQLKAGECRCGLSMDAGGAPEVSESLCGAPCSGETSSAGVSRCGSAAGGGYFARYIVRSKCVGTYGGPPLATPVAFTTGDGCVAAPTALRHLSFARGAAGAGAVNGTSVVDGGVAHTGAAAPRLTALQLTKSYLLAGAPGASTVWAFRRDDGRIAQAITPPTAAAATGDWGARISASADRVMVLTEGPAAAPSPAVYVFHEDADGGGFSYTQRFTTGDAGADGEGGIVDIFETGAALESGLIVAGADGHVRALHDDCRCHGMGSCSDASAVCACRANLDPTPGVNCKRCRATDVWDGSACVPGVCHDGCSGHGVCGHNGACVCDPGYLGDACQRAVPCEVLQQQLPFVLDCPSRA